MSLDRSPEAARTSVDRRRLLYGATTAFGAVGLGAAAWPLISQMNPDAETRARADTLEVDLAGIAPGTQRVVYWHGRPIFVAARTPAMLAAMQEEAFVRGLLDPRSDKRQQPSYARNWHRSVDPAFAVLVGICTRCGCVPTYFADAGILPVPGGYGCPCCAAKYDPAGRTFSDITEYNLPVPPHEIVAPSRLRIGRNAMSELFTLESVERI